MAYTPINWQTGDTITAEKMNKMDNGWGVQETQLFSESVTTAVEEGQPAPVGMLTYSTQITAPTLSVTFGNATYEVSFMTIEFGNLYGEMDEMGLSFTNYPFAILSTSGGNYVFTENAGTYSISASGETTEVSADFSSAVAKTFDINALPLKCESGVTTSAEMLSAQQVGRLLYFYTPSGLCLFLYDIKSHPMNFTPYFQNVSVDFDQSGHFIVTES